MRYDSDYTGPLWIELYLPDGRLYKRYLQLKTDQLFECTLDAIPGPTKAMLVRIVYGKGAGAKKLILMGG